MVYIIRLPFDWCTLYFSVSKSFVLKIILNSIDSFKSSNRETKFLCCLFEFLHLILLMVFLDIESSWSMGEIAKSWLIMNTIKSARIGHDFFKFSFYNDENSIKIFFVIIKTLVFYNRNFFQIKIQKPNIFEANMCENRKRQHETLFLVQSSLLSTPNDKIVALSW